LSVRFRSCHLPLESCDLRRSSLGDALIIYGRELVTCSLAISVSYCWNVFCNNNKRCVKSDTKSTLKRIVCMTLRSITSSKFIRWQTKV